MLRRVARRVTAVFVVWMVGVAPSARPQRAATQPALKLEAYVTRDGALTVFAGGSYVEPYFAMRALNTAADLGMNADSLARGYIAWQLQRLGNDSAFKRYCRGADDSWTVCGAADADDAALALWIELLYRTAGGKRMPAAWKRSADASRHALASLRDPATNVYVVSHAVPIALFMDNVEVLSALETSAHTVAAAIARDRTPLAKGAARLRSAINQVFWDSATRTFRVSSQAGAAVPRFYPEIVAQVFPAVFGYGTPVQSAKARTSQWLREHEGDWIAESDSGAAWGLVAVAAARTGHSSEAGRWMQRADRIRSGAHWNVVDEAIYRAGAADWLIRSFYLR
jgi:hypothetical protein